MIIWVFGPSGVGKKTLMFSTTNTNYKHEIRDKFGLNKYDTVIPVVIPNRKSTRNSDQRDEQIITRREIIANIYDMHSWNSKVCFMIHGQSIDLNFNIIKDIHENNLLISSNGGLLKNNLKALYIH